MLDPSQIDAFRQEVLDYYHEHRRSLPWREVSDDSTIDAYRVMVSEVMLQQTQVPRVVEKYHQFLDLFPTVMSLSDSSLGDVLAVWQGLGYNRRARFLREAAIKIVADYRGIVPHSVEELVTLPGIGINTASAIVAYSYNQPVVFIETNIRTVYLYYFFPNDEHVSDGQIKELVEQTLDVTNPREWYWALMDYGTYIKKHYGNPNARSRHYTKQSKFEGSKRQIRGRVIRELTTRPYAEEELIVLLDDDRTIQVITDLISERLVTRNAGLLQIAE